VSLKRVRVLLRVDPEDRYDRLTHVEVISQINQLTDTFFGPCDEDDIKKIRELQPVIIGGTRKIIKGTWNRVKKGEGLYGLVRVLLPIASGVFLAVLAMLVYLLVSRAPDSAGAAKGDSLLKAAENSSGFREGGLDIPVDEGRTPMVPQLSAELSHQLAELAATLGQFLTAAVFIAAATLIAVQLFKLPLRMAFQTLITEKWFSGRRGKAKIFADSCWPGPRWLLETLSPSSPSPSSPHPDQPQYQKSWPEVYSEAWHRRMLSLFTPRETTGLSVASTLLPNHLYMKQVQNAAQKALEHPARHPVLFAHVAADAAAADMVVAYHVDGISTENPLLLARVIETQQQVSAGPKASEDSFGPPTRGLASAIATAQDNVATAVERGLDDLQIRITFWWPIVVRAAAIIVGMLIAIAFGQAVGLGPRWSVLALIGVVAGYLASFAYDVLTILGGLRPRRE
jgi:hypothetical protein